MSEEQEQIALMDMVRLHIPTYPMLEHLFHIPNGGRRGKREAGRMKQAGVKPGVSDLFLPYPTDTYHGLWIEMKFGKNKPTKEQKKWLEAMEEYGYAYAVCWGWEEAWGVIVAYINCKLDRE